MARIWLVVAPDNRQETTTWLGPPRAVRLSSMAGPAVGDPEVGDGRLGVVPVGGVDGEVVATYSAIPPRRLTEAASVGCGVRLAESSVAASVTLPAMRSP